MPVVDRLTHEEHQRSFWAARGMYILILGLFLTICTLAVVCTMQSERNKTGFRAITVRHPISFIDTTYVDRHAH